MEDRRIESAETAMLRLVGGIGCGAGGTSRRLPVRPPNTPPIRATSNCAFGHRIARPLRPPRRHNRRQKRRRNGGRPAEGEPSQPAVCESGERRTRRLRSHPDRPRAQDFPLDLAVSSGGAHEARFRGRPAKERWSTSEGRRYSVRIVSCPI